MKNDEFGDRMKSLEAAYTDVRISPPDYLCVRLDGKGFSKFTKGFEKPFDQTLTDAFIEVTKRLVEDAHAKIGYTQSDEITLIFAPNPDGHGYMFGGKVSKLNSILASMTTAYFNNVLPLDKLAFFDCRAFAAPTIVEASNVLLWRAADAKKNSTSALFRWTAGHRAMDGLNQAKMKSYLLQHHDCDWEELPSEWKYGTFIGRTTYETYLSSKELTAIPESKRPALGTKVKRSTVGSHFMPYYYGSLSLAQRIGYLE